VPKENSTVCKDRVRATDNDQKSRPKTPDDAMILDLIKQRARISVCPPFRPVMVVSGLRSVLSARPMAVLANRFEVASVPGEAALSREQRQLFEIQARAH